MDDDKELLWKAIVMARDMHGSKGHIPLIEKAFRDYDAALLASKDEEKLIHGWQRSLEVWRYIENYLYTDGPKKFPEIVQRHIREAKKELLRLKARAAIKAARQVKR